MAQTRDLTRTDIIIDYLGQQYIVELKIWRGQSYNERGEQQPPVEFKGRTLIEAIV